MHIMRERLLGGQCAQKTPKGGKSAPKGVWKVVKTGSAASSAGQNAFAQSSAVTLKASTVYFSTAW